MNWQEFEMKAEANATLPLESELAAASEKMNLEKVLLEVSER
jgi:hypothetical protein